MVEFDNLQNIQRNMALRLNREIDMHQTVELLSLIQSLVTDKFGRVQKELILSEAKYAGMSEPVTIQLLDKLVKDRTLEEDGNYIVL